MMGLPERVFYSINELQDLWELSASDIKYYLLEGFLTAHVWLPMMSVYEVLMETEGNRIICTKELKHWEGYTPLYSHQCRTLYKTGKVYLRDFMCGEDNKKLFLPETANSVPVFASDIVILNEERRRFEKEHKFSNLSACRVKIDGRVIGATPFKRPSYFEQAFRKVHHAGIDFSFGAIQATVLQQLYEAAQKNEPWQNGKKMLERAGSMSFTMQNVFKSNPHWRNLIESDGRGDYRLQESFMTSLCQP